MLLFEALPPTRTLDGGVCANQKTEAADALLPVLPQIPATAFFHHRKANDWVGRVIGVLTLTPYDFWRRTHIIHHATSGNLDRRGFGDVTTLTVREYRARSRWRRICYRLYRHPVIMFGGPAYLFFVQHRLPVGLMRGRRQLWLSTMATNFAIAAIIATLIWFIGLKALLLVHLPIMLMAASAGVWLFYVQHQFEHTRWANDEDWDLHAAALHGSSHYVLPGLLRWFTANIGAHHIPSIVQPNSVLPAAIGPA